MMKHKDIHLIAATGGPGVVTAVLSSGKRGIGAGAGNPPALVDETADIRKAAEDIVNGCTFDNNLPCIAEKEIVAVDSIADELLHYMVSEQGCYMISKEEQDALTEVVLKGGRLNRKCVGRDAKTLLGMIGITVPDNIRCITFEGPKEHPLIAEELMMPILGVVRAKDFDDAVEQAVWLEHGNRHSAHIHSKNVDNITKICKSNRYSNSCEKRTILCSPWIRRRRILYVYDRKQNWRRTHKRKHIHKEKTLRNDRQPVHSLMECRQFRQEV